VSSYLQSWTELNSLEPESTACLLVGDQLKHNDVRRGKFIRPQKHSGLLECDALSITNL
jgi:hypothetical protein